MPAVMESLKVSVSPSKVRVGVGGRRTKCHSQSGQCSQCVARGEVRRSDENKSITFLPG